MFKLAVFTDEVSQDLDVAIKMALDYDLDAVEIRSVWNKPPQDLNNSEDIARIKDALDAAGLGVCAIASPFLKCDFGSAEQYREHLEILRNCIELGHALGANIIRGFTFWRVEDPRAIWGDILKAFEEPIRILEREDAIMGIENESSTNVGSAQDLHDFLTDLGSERVRATWDPCNHLYTEDPEPPYPDGYERVKDLIVHVHIKDAKRQPEGEPKITRVGEGDVDFIGQFRALIRDGYKGAASLETHWRPVELSKELVDRPGGEAYSASAETASRLCMDSIREILKKL
jgi:sugar phosphate isomerase/epimerase